MSERRLPPHLIALTAGVPMEVARRTLADAVEQGLRGVLIREPDWNDRQVLELALRLRELRTDLWIGVHDRVGLALHDSIDAVHLGYRSLQPLRVREMLPDHKAVGFSAHEHDDSEAREGADYLFFSPIYETPSKVGVLPVVGPEGLQRTCEAESRPVWALGGVTPERARDLIACGARGVAVRGAILGCLAKGAPVRAVMEEWHSALGETA